MLYTEQNLGELPVAQGCLLDMSLQAAGPGGINLELFAKGEGNVALLLGLLTQQDFYVRYHAVQLLTALAAGNSFRLQQVSWGCCRHMQAGTQLHSLHAASHAPALRKGNSPLPCLHQLHEQRSHVLCSSRNHLL